MFPELVEEHREAHDVAECVREGHDAQRSCVSDDKYHNLDYVVICRVDNLPVRMNRKLQSQPNRVVYTNWKTIC